MYICTHLYYIYSFEIHTGNKSENNESNKKVSDAKLASWKWQHRNDGFIADKVSDANIFIMEITEIKPTTCQMIEPHHGNDSDKADNVSDDRSLKW